MYFTMSIVKKYDWGKTFLLLNILQQLYDA